METKLSKELLDNFIQEAPNTPYDELEALTMKAADAFTTETRLSLEYALPLFSTLQKLCVKYKDKGLTNTTQALGYLFGQATELLKLKYGIEGIAVTDRVEEFLQILYDTDLKGVDLERYIKRYVLVQTLKH